MSDAKANDGYLMSKGYSYYVFGLLFLLYFFDYVDRQVVVALFPYLQETVAKGGWGLTHEQCGDLGAAVYWSIAIFTIPISILVDRWSRKKSIGIMSTIWGLATLACAFTGNLTQLILARIVIGVGEAGYAPGGTAMISALFPQRIRSMMIGVWNSSIPLGMAAGMIIGSRVAASLGWRHAFGIVAIPGLLVAISFFFIKDYKTVALTKEEQHPEANIGSQTKEALKRMGLKDLLMEFANTPSLLLTYLGFAGMMFITTAYAYWLPTFFEHSLGIDRVAAGDRTAGILLTAIIGSPLGGFIADKWMKRNIKARLLLPSISAFATAALFFFGLQGMAVGTQQYIVLVLAGTCSIMFASSAIAVTQDVIHPGLRAISYALCVVTQHLFGSAWGPKLTGMWIDDYGVLTALSIVPIMAVTSGILFFLASRFYVRDLEKVAKVHIELED